MEWTMPLWMAAWAVMTGVGAGGTWSEPPGWSSSAGASAIASSGVASEGAHATPEVAPDGELAFTPELRLGGCGVDVPWVSVGSRDGSRVFRGRVAPTETASSMLRSDWCVGRITPEPQICVRVRDYAVLTFEVTTPTEENTTLSWMGRALEGAVCDDDGTGTRRARLDVYAEPGEYRVWVGAVDEDRVFDWSVTMTVREAVEDYH